MRTQLHRFARRMLSATTLWWMCSAASAYAATINVPGDYPTIQGAVTAASDGDTVQVAAGTYTEAITITKPLTLLGAQANVDPVPSGRSGGESVISNQYAVSIQASDVTINGFEITNFRFGINVPGPFPAPDLTRQNIHISYNWIHSSTSPVTVGFNAEPGVLKNLFITHNYFDVYDTSTSAAPLAAIGFSSSTSPGDVPTYENVEISYNVIQNLDGATPSEGGYGLFAGADPSKYVINTITIKGNYFKNAPYGANFNIGNISNGYFQDNIVETIGGSIGIDTGTMSGNTFRYGARLGLWGTDYGFTRPSTNVVVTNNNFTDEVYGRGLTLGAGSVASTIFANTNAFRISAVVGDLIRNLGVGTLDATNNWWGSAAGPSGNPGTFTGSITTTQWLTYDTEDPAKLASPPYWPYAGVETRYPGFWPLAPKETMLSYTGPYLDADGNSTTTLSALLASADVSCYQGQTVTFYVDSVVAGSSTTGSDGKVSLTIPLATNETYDITVEFGGTAACLASSASGTVTVAPSASVASGGGWYLPNGSEDRAQFGFVANRKYNKKTGKYVVSGELEWRFEKAARLKSAAVTQIGYTTITGYTKCALVSGTAELQLWDSSTSTWLSPSVVNFVATACDGGTGRKGGKKYDKPDAFGVSIIGQTVPGESGAIRLGGGSIKVN